MESAPNTLKKNPETKTSYLHENSIKDVDSLCYGMTQNTIHSNPPSYDT